MRSALVTVRLLHNAILLMWRAEKRLFLLSMALQVAAGACVGAQLWIGRILVERMTVQEAILETSSVLGPSIALVVAISLASFLLSAQLAARKLVTESAVRTFNEQLLVAATQVHLEQFESAEFFDHLQRARANGVMTPVMVSTSLLEISAAATTILGVATALVFIHPMFLIVALFAYVPAWIVIAKNSRELYGFSIGATPNDRERALLATIMTGRDSAKEIRAFSLDSYLLSKWRDLYDTRFREVSGVVSRQLRRGLWSSSLTALIRAGGMALVGFMLVQRQISLAEAAAVIIGFQAISARLEGISVGFGTLQEHLLHLGDFIAFTDRQRTRYRPPDRQFRQALTAANISFSYPGSTSEALSNVTLTIPRTGVVALVGENGSGKTTLAKILAGLYMPSSGEVLLDGEPAREALTSKSAPAVVFQDFVKYPLSARENIGVAQWEMLESGTLIQQAAMKSGIAEAINELPLGMETLLSKELEGGYDLSGGQWQRLALARCFFRGSDFIILDEPSAALDPRAEFELFTTVKELCQDRAVLLITHRFSSVRSADYIYVLDRGSLIEEGTHEQLMERGGKYAELYSYQLQAYGLAGV